MLRPVTRTYILMHPSAKMLNSCFDIFARTHNNPKEPLIATFKILFTTIKSMAVVKSSVLHFTVEALLKFIEYIHQVENLLVVIAHHSSTWEKRTSHVWYSKAAFTCERQLVEGRQNPSLVFLLDIIVIVPHFQSTLRE